MDAGQATALAFYDRAAATGQVKPLPWPLAHALMLGPAYDVLRARGVDELQLEVVRILVGQREVGHAEVGTHHRVGLAAVREPHLVALSHQERLEDLAHDFFIVDDQNRTATSHW